MISDLIQTNLWNRELQTLSKEDLTELAQHEIMGTNIPLKVMLKALRHYCTNARTHSQEDFYQHYFFSDSLPKLIESKLGYMVAADCEIFLQETLHKEGTLHSLYKEMMQALDIKAFNAITAQLYNLLGRKWELITHALNLPNSEFVVLHKQ